ncbi:hypothetical protein ILUMI_01775 [Ignelater luminosus]|uniref:Uncharacterized protein n=1 Tax=Ignelater luminosus TaxID=2038154 RepID=A0A8K0DJK4_IGNLU|nr:hypothetical protein ILUMI_01775 [Ignelater luminosus]
MTLSGIPRGSFVVLLLFLKLFAEKEFDFHFFQDDYNFLLERAEMGSYNKDYMRTASVVSFRYNRTVIAFNMTLRFKVDVGSDLVAVDQAYKFVSNEYRLFAAIRMGGKLCTMFDANVAGVKTQARKCGNMTQCFFLKDKTYRLCNVVPDESKLPPRIPKGRYMLEIDVSYSSVSLFVVKVYFTVTRPEV